MDSRMIKQLQDMQKKMVKAQEDLANETVTGSAGGGAVTVEMTGHHMVTAVTIDKDAVDPDDVESLQDMVLAAFNQALEKAQEMTEKKMGAITGGMNLPGMF
ncbi:MAG TPA: YbaB/EbfC family nucleoid-associated protein [Chloroflexia bacterium]|jgi:DNA-binding YbaB/EbfC family protein|nr:YbaB/EbfC family nucleoid-associated protein [Chloroflexia bacterium]